MKANLLPVPNVINSCGKIKSLTIKKSMIGKNVFFLERDIYTVIIAKNILE
jgi:hypothetical protein